MDDNKKKALAGALTQIERQFGKGAVMRLGDTSVSRDVMVVSTGSLGLDIALGIGGLPRGRVTEIYGPESSGKTTLALQVIAETQRLAARVASGELPRPDFVVWPENGTDMDPLTDGQTNRAVWSAVEAIGVPLVVGGLTDGPGTYERQTTTIVWYPGTGPAATRWNLWTRSTSASACCPKFHSTSSKPRAIRTCAEF